MFSLFIKQGKSIAISLHFAIIVILTYLNNDILKRMANVLRTNPDSSKYFFEIFTNFIWESSLNIYYLDKTLITTKTKLADAHFRKRRLEQLYKIYLL